MKNFIEKTMDRAFYRTAGMMLSVRKKAADFIIDEEGETNLIAILLIIVVTVALSPRYETSYTYMPA